MANYKVKKKRCKILNAGRFGIWKTANGVALSESAVFSNRTQRSSLNLLFENVAMIYNTSGFVYDDKCRFKTSTLQTVMSEGKVHFYFFF